jgi:hypothetical protein
MYDGMMGDYVGTLQSDVRMLLNENTGSCVLQSSVAKCQVIADDGDVAMTFRDVDSDINHVKITSILLLDASSGDEKNVHGRRFTGEI